MDTGFNGFVSLPAEAVARLQLPFGGSARVVLGDGREVKLALYDGEAVFAGQAVEVDVVESDGDPLVGMALLRGLELRIQVTDQGAVSVASLV